MSQDIIGSRKGDYEILALLGVGGMGQVYKVRNVLSDRVEAMKVLLPNLADQKGLADRFIREIKVLAGIHHPNIAELRTALTIDNQLVMIMEFVEGSTLAARVQQGAIPYGQALGYIQQVLAALSYAHSQKIIHRDIKPANMMLTPTGVVKLMDFGIARQDGDVGLTVTNSTVGSIAYMSPEQVKGEAADARSDLYSVGVSLYEMVTGQRPFQGDTGFSIMQAHLQTMPKPPIEVRPDLPATLSDLIMMAVAKDPAKRFQSADAFSRAIGSVKPIVEGTAPIAPIAATPVPSAPSPQPTMPSMSAPPPVAETMVAGSGSSATSFQATQFASAPAPIIPQTPAPRPAPVVVAAKPPSSQPMPPPPQNSYRGFYIALGAMIVLMVLVAAGFYVPRHLKTQAAQQSSSSASDSSATPASPATPDASAAAQPPSTPDSSSSAPAASMSASTPAASASATSSVPAPSSDSSASRVSIPPRAGTAASSSTASDASAPHVNIAPRAGATTASNSSDAPVAHVTIAPRNGASSAPSVSDSSASHVNIPPRNGGSSNSAAPDSNPSAANAPSRPAPADAAALQQAETETDQMSSRGAAVTTGLDNLKKSQAAQGIGLRGDMAAAEQRMQNNLAKAQSAVAAGDATQAQHYLSLAEPDVEKLEHFLGH